jgi:hypothetical protein
MIEYIVIGIVIATAAGFTGWRAWQTLRISKGKACGTGCGKCGPAEKS